MKIIFILQKVIGLESELVSGFMTEHSAVPFVFFFLGEYSSIVLFSCITAILFLGGYNIPELFVNNTILNIQSIILGIKTCIFCFLFVFTLFLNFFCNLFIRFPKRHTLLKKMMDSALGGSHRQ